MKSNVYLDYAATTPLDPRVQQAMQGYGSLLPGGANPSSSHAFGIAAAEDITAAASSLARLVNGQADGIIWTSGATESNNLAILGSALALLERQPSRKRLLVLATDHSAAIEPARAAARFGFKPVILPVCPAGRLTADALALSLDEDVALVSFALVNNETGVIQDIAALAPMIKAAGARLHVDAAQAAGRQPIDVMSAGIDLLSFSGHKFYGPKGVGALYCRPGLALEPLFYGGGQQSGQRPGTLPVSLIKGMASAFALFDDQAERDRQHALRQRLVDGLAPLGQVVINGYGATLAPHIASLSFPGVHGAALMEALEGLAVSHGSACGSQHGPSHVLRAMGRPDALAHATLRVSIGRQTCEADIDTAVERIGRAVTRLRRFSPVWRELQEGLSIQAAYRTTTPLAVA